MTKAEAIRELIEQIEAGELKEYHCPSQFKALPFPQRGRAAAAFMGKLDAALALHEALLPGWRMDEMTCSKHGDWVVRLRSGGSFQFASAMSKTPARAWLLAILKAYLADMEQDQ